MERFAISIYTTKPFQSKYSIGGTVYAKSKFQALLKFVRMIKSQSIKATLTKVQYVQHC